MSPPLLYIDYYYSSNLSIPPSHYYSNLFILCVSRKVYMSLHTTVMPMIQCDGRHFLYAKICFVADQTQHMFIYPALTWLYPLCRFAWQSLQAIYHGTRLHDLWQRLFLIHKSQKDQFKIYEQSVLQQPVISVAVGQ